MTSELGVCKYEDARENGVRVYVVMCLCVGEMCACVHEPYLYFICLFDVDSKTCFLLVGPPLRALLIRCQISKGQF